MEEDRIILKLIEHDEKLAQTATKDDLAAVREELVRGQDETLVILRRLDQERVFGTARVDRIEEDVSRIKLKLNVA